MPKKKYPRYVKVVILPTVKQSGTITADIRKEGLFGIRDVWGDRAYIYSSAGVRNWKLRFLNR